MDKCCEDKCCLDKCQCAGWHLLKRVQGTFFYILVQIGPLTAEICTFSGGWVVGEIGIKAISTSIELS